MTRPFLPPATIGIIGGGQLGMMIVREAGRMGYRTAVWDPDPDCPASPLAGETITAPFSSTEAADRLAACSDVITYEFENVDAEIVRRLESLKPTRPGSMILSVSQDRRREKQELAAHGFPVVPYAEATGTEAIKNAIDRIGLPVVVKTATSGYDGKGQTVLRSTDDCSRFLASPRDVAVVVERFLPLACELSVIAVRDASGTTVTFPVAENVHRDNILHTTTVPAHIPGSLQQRAEELGRAIITAFGITGILCVEMFVTSGSALMVNELAPRPHNSGHYTLDACDISQFEALVRSICGLSVPHPRLLTPCAMVNLLGKHLPLLDIGALFDRPGTKLHLYGKKRSEPRRKMGHVTILAPAAEAVAGMRDEIAAMIDTDTLKTGRPSS